MHVYRMYPHLLRYLGIICATMYVTQGLLVTAHQNRITPELEDKGKKVGPAEYSISHEKEEKEKEKIMMMIVPHVGLIY